MWNVLKLAGGWIDLSRWFDKYSDAVACLRECEKTPGQNFISFHPTMAEVRRLP
jgi:hypothetical protein